MFYPVDSLKRGGRFYLCWVADSWPLRFATITHRQLWSQDIRKICDELMEVMTNESGRPTNRYSLRLSSQLMRGLVRLYQRKVSVLLSDLCMINANVFKHANKRFNIHEVLDLPHRERPQPQILEMPQVLEQEEPGNEPRIEELIQNSGNIVSNVQDITLKEAAIPEFLLPPNDGFGEENPEQALQLVGDRTIEMMMMPADASAAQHSGLDTALNITDKSHDKSRLVPQEIQMERLSDLDTTLVRRSDGASLLPVADFEKDIPEISQVPIPELPVPEEKEQELAAEIPKEVEQPREEGPRVRRTARMSEEIVLEELEETEPPAKRRRIRRRLIIDKNIKISSKVLRARVERPNIELRCEDSTDDIIYIQVPNEVFMRRPCHAGYKERSNLALALTRLFMRNLGVVNRPTFADRELEEGAMHSSQRSMPRLKRIEEVPETTEVEERAQHQVEPILETTTNQDNLPPQVDLEVDLSKDLANVFEGHKEQDIADMLTQKIDTLSQQAKKLASEDADSSPKIQRSIGYVTFRKKKTLEESAIVREAEESLLYLYHRIHNNASHRMATLLPAPDLSRSPRSKPCTKCGEKSGDLSKDTIAEKQVEIPELEIEIDKENLPENKQTPKRGVSRDAAIRVTSLLQEAGLAHIPSHQEIEQPAEVSQRPSRKRASEDSETPLGSLDRTKVSLGESEHTTDSRRFIRDHWGTEGAMIKILKMIKEGKFAVTVETLIAQGPVLSGYKSIIAAQCFTSILKLKQNGFIKVKKDPNTLEIEDIILGPVFY